MGGISRPPLGASACQPLATYDQFSQLCSQLEVIFGRGSHSDRQRAGFLASGAPPAPRFAGRTRRSLQGIPGSSISRTPLRANSPARRLLLVSTHLVSTSRPPVPDSNLSDVRVISRQLNSSPADSLVSTLRRHFVASFFFQPTGRIHLASSPALSCRCVSHWHDSPHVIRSSTRTSQTPFPASSTLAGGLPCRRRRVGTRQHAPQVSNETDATARQCARLPAHLLSCASTCIALRRFV